MRKSCSTCRSCWRCMESDREYPCKDYKKKVRKRDEKRTEMHGEELSRAQADLQFAWRLAFTGLAIAAVATGAMVAIAQAAGMF